MGHLLSIEYIMNNRKSELLVILQEEAAEVIQAVSKTIRFGENARNVDALETEIGDFVGVLKMLMEEHHLNALNIENAAEAKIVKLPKYMTNKKV
jgi:NTP pyrophosphatase (non-canonical NTP hydrolase)